MKEHWEIVCRDVEAFKWNTKTCALWHLVKIEFLLSDVQKDIYLLNSPCSSSNSPQATTNTDELTLFGVISSSDSDVSSVTSEMGRELEQHLGEVIDETYNSLCPLDPGANSDSKVKKDQLNNDLFVELACIKQTAQKQPDSGMQQATGGEGLGSKDRTPIPATATKKSTPTGGGAKAPHLQLALVIRGRQHVPYEQTMAAKLARENRQQR